MNAAYDSIEAAHYTLMTPDGCPRWWFGSLAMLDSITPDLWAWLTRKHLYAAPVSLQ